MGHSRGSGRTGTSTTLVRLGPKRKTPSVRTQMSTADSRNARMLRQKFAGPMKPSEDGT